MSQYIVIWILFETTTAAADFKMENEKSVKTEFARERIT